MVLGVESYADPSCMGEGYLTRVAPAMPWLAPQLAGTFPPDPCVDLDYLGRCNGARAEWCEDDVYARYDCRLDDTTRGWIDEQTGYDCVYDLALCAELGYTGRCEDGVAQWCEQEHIVRRWDCRADGLRCAWVGDGVGYDCVKGGCATGGSSQGTGIALVLMLLGLQLRRRRRRHPREADRALNSRRSGRTPKSRRRGRGSRRRP